MKIYFEMQKIGNIMKVSAIDSESGTEVVLQGPSNASPRALEQAAAKKLIYVMNKQKKGS